MTDRELNEAVHERVMGERVLPLAAIPHYCGDIAEAWRVLERVQRENGDIVIGLLRHTDGRWWCSMLGDGSHATTAPRAICHAALKAKEAHDESN